MKFNENTIGYDLSFSNSKLLLFQCCQLFNMFRSSFQRGGVSGGMYLENDPLAYGPGVPPGGIHHATHLSPPASLARVSPDPLSDPLYHDSYYR